MIFQLIYIPTFYDFWLLFASKSKAKNLKLSKKVIAQGVIYNIAFKIKFKSRIIHL